MEIERAYHVIASYFDLWVRIVEIESRREEALGLVSGPAQNLLVVAPPTDTGTRLLAEANGEGTTTLLCFSERLRRAAEAYQRSRGFVVNIAVAPFAETGFDDGVFTAIYANCFFDFLQDEQVRPAMHEMRRILVPGGKLHAVYMGNPTSAGGRAWRRLLDTFETLSGGCHPVSIEGALSEAGFAMKTNDHKERFGFPLRYTVAEA